MKPAIVTDNLNIWIIDTDEDANEFLAARRMYVATLRNDDWPGVVCTLSVCHYPVLGAMVDWVETAAMQRRSGYARELWLAAEKHYGRNFVGEGCTDEGTAFMAAMHCKRWGRA